MHTNAPATDCELLYYLYDMKERHKVVNNMRAKVRKDPAAFDKFANLVEDCRGPTPFDLVEKVFQTVEKFSQGAPQRDDITLLAVQLEGRGSRRLAVRLAAGLLERL